MKRQVLTDRARVIIIILIIALIFLFLFVKCKPYIEPSAPCRVLNFHNIPYDEMVFKMRTVLPTLEPWREVWIHWIDDSGEHRATSYYSYDELHEKALKEVKNVQMIMIFCESKPSTVPKTPDVISNYRPSGGD